MVLSDHPVTADESIAQTQENYYGINVTHVEAALAHLLSEGQEGVVITTFHELHKHKQLAAALHKATRSHSESVVDVAAARDYKGTDMGIHSHSHTYIDPDVLMQEIEMSADMLTHGLVSEWRAVSDLSVIAYICFKRPLSSVFLCSNGCLAATRLQLCCCSCAW